MRWNYINGLFLISTTIVALLPFIVHSRKYYSFAKPETPQYYSNDNDNQRYVNQNRFKGPQLSRRNLLNRVNPITKSSSNHFAEPPKQQRLKYPNQQLSRRYALQNAQSLGEYDDITTNPIEYDYGLEKDGEINDQYFNIGGFPSGFNNEDGWGSSPFLNNDNKVQEDYHQDVHPDKSFVNEARFPNQPNVINNLGDHANKFPQFDVPQQQHNLNNLHSIGSEDLNYLNEKKYRDTIGLKKKQKYKSNVYKTNEQLFGPGGLTKNKINQAVKEFGEATVGEENKDEILYHTNQLFSNIDHTNNKIRNNLDKIVLSIGDATIGNQNKQKLRYKAKGILTTSLPYLTGTVNKLKTNSIHSKVKHKTQQTLDDLNYQANREANQQLGKLKKSVPSLMTKLDAKAKELARSVLSKFMGKDNHGKLYNNNNEKSVSLGSLGFLFTGATAMVVELIQLAWTGTPSLYGLDGIIQ